MNNNIKAIIFDVDGVIFNSQDDNRNYLWSKNIKQDLCITTQHFKAIFSTDWEMIIRGKIKFLDHLNNIFKTELFQNLAFTPQEYIHYWLSNDHNINQDMLNLVSTLKIPCYLGTNQEELRTQNILKSVGHYFQGCFTSYEIGFMKPEIGFFSYIEKTLSLLPSEILLIDDTKNNIDAARNCNWNVYHYQNDMNKLKSFLKNYEPF